MYGSAGSPSYGLYDDCVAPLVEALFQGYNATVLAYGQVKRFYLFVFLFLQLFIL